MVYIPHLAGAGMGTERPKNMANADLLENKMMEVKTQLGFDRTNKEHLKRLNVVMDTFGPKRWRAADKFLCYVNPMGYDPETGVPTLPYRITREHIVQENGKLKTELHDAKFGRSKESLKANSSTQMRHALRMPALLIWFVQLVDPTMLTGTPEERRSSLHQLMQEFPEFKLPKRI